MVLPDYQFTVKTGRRKGKERKGRKKERNNWGATIYIFSPFQDTFHKIADFGFHQEPQDRSCRPIIPWQSLMAVLLDLVVVVPIAPVTALLEHGEHAHHGGLIECLTGRGPQQTKPRLAWFVISKIKVLYPSRGLMTALAKDPTKETNPVPGLSLRGAPSCRVNLQNSFLNLPYSRCPQERQNSLCVPVVR